MWGILATLLVTRTHPGKAIPAFFDGMGKAYSDVFGIIICAGVFVAGLNAIGLIEAAKTLLIDYPQAARFGGTIGPFLMAIVIGSGDAAAYAFNEAITPMPPPLAWMVLIWVPPPPSPATWGAPPRRSPPRPSWSPAWSVSRPSIWSNVPLPSCWSGCYY